MAMTPRQRAMSALRGELPDRTPFLSDIFPPQGNAERELRSRGMALCGWLKSSAVSTPNVKTQSVHYTDETGRNLIRTVYWTPLGELSTLVEPQGFTTWKHEYIFKSPDDYRRLLFLFEDSVVESRHDKVRESLAQRGDDVLSVDFAGWSPLSDIIYHHMGTETFCYQWADNRDEVLKLYQALRTRKRGILQFAAESPLEVVIYDANVIPQIVGPDNFRKYFMPDYEEAVDLLHRHGKLVGSHFDGDNTPFMELIARTPFDFINAYDVSFSPPVSQARKAWPQKALWLNYPSAWHLLTPEEITNKTVGLIQEAAPGNGFLIGITETVPPERLLTNFKAILDGIEKYHESL